MPQIVSIQGGFGLVFKMYNFEGNNNKRGFSSETVADERVVVLKAFGQIAVIRRESSLHVP